MHYWDCVSKVTPVRPKIRNWIRPVHSSTGELMNGSTEQKQEDDSPDDGRASRERALLGARYCCNMIGFPRKWVSIEANLR